MVERLDQSPDVHLRKLEPHGTSLGLRVRQLGLAVDVGWRLVRP
jgi:hypothetical protein